jgi:hypothetical protein
MSSIGAASLAALSPARAAASRRNGARSHGPKTSEGKERSSQNALKHGFRAQKFLVVGDESPREFDAFEAALLDELAPKGALQSLLARRIARAAWRLERAERIEAHLFARRLDGERDLGLAVIRDGNGTRSLDTLLRYRGSAQAELWRALRLLKALQAEAAAAEQPSEPEAPRIPDATAPVPAAAEPAPAAAPPHPPCATPAVRPIEPESRSNPGESRPSMPRESASAPRSWPRPGSTPEDDQERSTSSIL